MLVLSQGFARTDKHQNGHLSRQEFEWTLKAAGLLLTNTELQNLFKYYDKNCDDKVNYPLLKASLIPALDETRAQVVHEAFSKLDQ